MVIIFISFYFLILISSKVEVTYLKSSCTLDGIPIYLSEPAFSLSSLFMHYVVISPLEADVSGYLNSILGKCIWFQILLILVELNEIGPTNSNDDSIFAKF